jgi:hypothetical protein
MPRERIQAPWFRNIGLLFIANAAGCLRRSSPAAARTTLSGVGDLCQDGYGRSGRNVSILTARPRATSAEAETVRASRLLGLAKRSHGRAHEPVRQ